MKRTLKGMVLLGRNGRPRFYGVYFVTRRWAERDAGPGESVVPCTLTWEAKTKPRLRKKGGRR